MASAHPVKKKPRGLIIAEWTSGHPRWQDLLALVEEQGESQWFEAAFNWHLSAHVMVAVLRGQVAGYLRFAVQVIGLEDDHDGFLYQGKPLTEAKVMAFGVRESLRRQGIGSALQYSAMDRAREIGCYQMRSFSAGQHQANHQLKIAMGFSVYPVVRDGDTHAAYFIMTL